MRKVLLLGNGITYTTGGISWNDIITNMAKKYNPSCSLSDIEKQKKSTLPMPLQAVTASNNRINEYLFNNQRRFYGKITNEKKRQFLQRILSVGFDDILTTNYSYEIEIAATEKNDISNYQLDKIRRTTRNHKKAEGKYLLHTYNEVNYMGVSNRVWHIHGVAKNPSSMVIGHYYYGNLVSRYSNALVSAHQRFRDNLDVYTSWLDGFIMGDVFILGCGFDPSEFDLWWLVERKKIERMNLGKIFYFAPKWERDNNCEKYELMNVYGIEVKDDITNSTKNYDLFYEEALNQNIKA